MIYALICWTFTAICYAVVNKLLYHHDRSIWKNVAKTSFFGAESWWRKYSRDNWPKSHPMQVNLSDSELDNLLNAAMSGDAVAKTRWRPKGKLAEWYYKRFNIAYHERFPLSATALVFVTDAHHLFQWLMFNFMALAMGAAIHDPAFHVERWIITSFIFRLAFTITHSLFFEIVLTKPVKTVKATEGSFVPDYIKGKLNS